MERLKRVDQPTTKITENVQRFDEREHGFNRARRGDLGPVAARERPRLVGKFPISAALAAMTAHLAPVVDGEVAPQKAPIPEDPPDFKSSHQTVRVLPEGGCYGNL